jgi:GAF domain-containing protein
MSAEGWLSGPGGTWLLRVAPPPRPATSLDRASAFAEIAQNFRSRPSLQETLDEIVGTAVAVIDGCEFAGVLIMGPGRRVTAPAASAAVVRACNNAQVASRSGPCLAAAAEGRVVRVADLRRDERWPRFTTAAAALGMASMVSLPLATDRDRIGALNLYASGPDAFDGESVDVGSIFAVHASIAIASARLEEQLRAAVQSRGLIGQAVGILMARNGLTAPPAFELLKLASQHRNVRLRTLAEDVVEGRLKASHVLPSATE